MKNIIINNINTVLIDLGYSNDKLNVQKTKNSMHGDYSTNIAMILAQHLKTSPSEIAEEFPAVIVPETGLKTGGSVASVSIFAS